MQLWQSHRPAGERRSNKLAATPGIAEPLAPENRNQRCANGCAATQHTPAQGADIVPRETGAGMSKSRYRAA
jgi:hypothetical protein